MQVNDPVNCQNAIRAISTLPPGDEAATRNTDVDLATGSQAAVSAEGSTTIPSGSRGQAAPKRGETGYNGTHGKGYQVESSPRPLRAVLDDAVEAHGQGAVFQLLRQGLQIQPSESRCSRSAKAGVVSEASCGDASEESARTGSASLRRPTRDGAAARQLPMPAMRGDR